MESAEANDETGDGDEFNIDDINIDEEGIEELEDNDEGEE